MLYEYDATMEKCPLPLVKMRVILAKMELGDRFLIQISDSGSISDIPKLLSKKGYVFTQEYISNHVLQLLIEYKA